jgi:hypothetical protein
LDRGSETDAGLVPPYAKTLTTLIAGHALHCGQLLDEIGHDTGMSNDSGDADGTIGSRVALDEFEVDHLCGSRDPDLGREAGFDLSPTNVIATTRNRLAAPIGTADGQIAPSFYPSGCYLAAFRLTLFRFARDQLCTMSR